MSVSVIIPTWNRSELLVAAVRSALTQTVPPLEVLVCDDGSTDDSEAAVAAIGDARVRWLAGERGGRPAIPRNRGIRESRGEWIAFLDNDDEWFPEKLERQLDAVGRCGCLAACSNAVRFVPGHGAGGNYLRWSQPLVTFEDLLQVNQVVCSSALVHRSLFATVEGFPEAPELKALEDYALWLRVAAMTKFAYLSEPLLSYRDEAATSVRKEGLSVWRQRDLVFANLQDWLARTGTGGVLNEKVRQTLRRDRAAKLLQAAKAPLVKMKKALMP